jgi:heme-degrading monooxygenase HmoA
VDPISSVGLIKIVGLTLRPGHRERFLESQAVWNRESRSALGYLGEVLGASGPDELHVLTFWRSRDEYERWMEQDHDRIATLAGAEAHYDQLDVRVIDRLTESE